MGLRGPRPQSDIVKALRGNPGRRPINLDEGVHPPVVVPDPPDWLNEDARVEWDRITDELVELGLIAEIDLASIATYCQTWGDLCLMERAFNAQRDALASRGVKAEAATVYLHVITTPTRQKRPSPFYERMRELRLDLDRMVRNFGGNAAARARVQASDDLPKPEVEPKGSQGEEAPTATVTSFARFRR